MSHPPASPPREMVALRDRVDEWRRTRACFGPMPADLWDEAVALGRRRGLYATARGVGINYDSLAKRVRALQPHGQAAEVAFVEWTGAGLVDQAPGGGNVLQVSEASGRQMTVRLAGGTQVDLAGIVAAFCAARP